MKQEDVTKDDVAKDEWRPCPRCESKRVDTMSKAFFILMFLGTGSMLFWLGFLFFPFFIISALLMLMAPLGFILPKMYQCKDCNYTWTKNDL